jgi:hypothetical protein
MLGGAGMIGRCEMLDEIPPDTLGEQHWNRVPYLTRH